MTDEIDWSVTTFEDNRRQQQREYLLLPFRDKVAALEEMAGVAAWLAARRAASDPRRNSEAAAP